MTTCPPIGPDRPTRTAPGVIRPCRRFPLPRWRALPLALGLLAAACGAGASAPQPEDRLAPAEEPFVWQEAEIARHLGLSTAEDGSASTYVLADGAVCEIGRVLTSAMAVRLHQQRGDLVATNPTESAGVRVIGGPDQVRAHTRIHETAADPPGAACLPELRTSLGGLSPERRSREEKQADLAALDDALMDAADAFARGGVAAQADVPGQAAWPGLQVAASRDMITISGASLGRCRQVVIAGDGTMTRPSPC